MSTTTSAPTALPAASPARRRDGDAMRFGAFPITELQSFPPPRHAQCWVYLTLNAEIALSLPQSPALQQLIRQPRVRISVDGQWLWWGLRRKYQARALSKLSGSDLIHRLAEHCSQSGQRLLLLGSSAQANLGAVQALQARWPSLAVSGIAPPHYTPGSDGEQAMHAASLAAIEACNADFVVLGLGASKEQRFALQLAAQLDGRVTGLMCFGGAIDLASGRVKRAPLLWQRLGAEGLYRVLQQPARLGRLARVLRIIPVLVSGQY